MHTAYWSFSSQFLNETHEFSELVLARMALLVDQSRSVLPLRSNLESCGGKINAGLGHFHLNWPEPVLFGRLFRTNEKHPKSSRDSVAAATDTCVLSILPRELRFHNFSTFVQG